MIDIVGEWLAKARQDYEVASLLVRRKRMPAETICFHCQQAVEKFMKALLQANDIRFGKTHDLLELLEPCQKIAPTLTLMKDDLNVLSPYAVKFRYPGRNASPEQARSAVIAAKRVRTTILSALGRRK
jgi:HEPN domain-containing protein